MFKGVSIIFHYFRKFHGPRSGRTTVTFFLFSARTLLCPKQNSRVSGLRTNSTSNLTFASYPPSQPKYSLHLWNNVLYYIFKNVFQGDHMLRQVHFVLTCSTYLSHAQPNVILPPTTITGKVALGQVFLGLRFSLDRVIPPAIRLPPTLCGSSCRQPC